MAASSGAAFAHDGGDPRLSVDGGMHNEAYILPQRRLLHDPSVTFEEYHYYALRTRAEEQAVKDSEKGQHTGILQVLFPPKNAAGVARLPDNGATFDEKVEHRRSSVNANLANMATREAVTTEEWTNASRAFRTATWAACFYLITTDILGPFGIGYVVLDLMLSSRCSLI